MGSDTSREKPGQSKEEQALSAVQKGRRAGLSLARAERLAEVSQGAPAAEAEETPPTTPKSRSKTLAVSLCVIAAAAALTAGYTMWPGVTPGEVSLAVSGAEVLAPVATPAEKTEETEVVDSQLEAEPAEAAGEIVIVEAEEDPQLQETLAVAAIVEPVQEPEAVVESYAMAAENTAPVVRRGCAGELHAQLEPLRIEFLPGDSALAPESAKQIEDYAALVDACDPVRLRIDGYADPDDGGRPSTLLSWRRAQTVFEHLEAAGFQMEHYTAVGHGVPTRAQTFEDSHHRYVEVGIK